MWEAVLVLLVVALAVSRISSFINSLFESVLPERLFGTGLSGERLVSWIVVAVVAVVVVLVVEYDPLAAIGVASDADDIWNILLLIAAADVADFFFRGRLLRAGAEPTHARSDV
jgi:hypothetical protein